jgi:hypothetical protein
MIKTLLQLEQNKEVRKVLERVWELGQVLEELK